MADRTRPDEMISSPASIAALPLIAPLLPLGQVVGEVLDEPTSISRA